MCNNDIKPAIAEKSDTEKLKVLILKSKGANCPSRVFEALIAESQNLTGLTADSVEKAIVSLQEQDFDAVISGTADFLPLERAVVAEKAMSILNTVGEGVCVVNENGAALWSNFKMEGFSEAVKEGIFSRSRGAFASFARDLETLPQNVPLRPRKYSLTDEKTGRYFEMIVNPMLDEHNRISHVATVVWDETASRKLQQRIDAIDKAGRELVRLEAETLSNMVVEERINLLQDKIVRYARDLLHFDNFVVRLLNRRNNQLEVLFGAGVPMDNHAELFANIENNGITGYVAATGRSYICNSLSADPRYIAGMADAKCCLTVPLLLHDKVVGTLNVESAQDQAFDEDDRQMAEIFGRYIAIAMNILDLMVVERYQTTGQAADNLNRQVSEPLNAILTQASLIMEDYIGHDDLRHRLQGIVDNVVSIKRSMKDLQDQPKGIFGVQSISDVEIDPLLAGKQILLVDDEEFIRQTITDVVQKYGCIVDAARDGREAKALLGKQQYHLVISDIKLPFANGYEIFATARDLDSEIPVILMTGFGYDPNHSIVRANREGLNAVLYKPFKVDQLIGEIRRALGKGA